MDFNWLGDLAFCPVVRKTDAVLQGLQYDVLAHAKLFAASIGPQMLVRALSWAYLSDTEGSFAIEGETPSVGKASRFAALLKRAHAPRPLTEDYLIELQNATVSNPFDKATQFRTEQNRLQGNALGAAGVTYVPPRPELYAELMEQLMALSNQRPAGLDPLVHAGVVSFAFVFLHPFMDGNGRLSRFLIHHCLGQSGGLPAGFLLPVSVAMKKHEEQYWQALTAFSRPARELCQVLWSGMTSTAMRGRAARMSGSATWMSPRAWPSHWPWPRRRWRPTCGKRWSFWGCLTTWPGTSTTVTTCAAPTWPR